MNFWKMQLNWFDLLVVGLIAFGIWRGKKRGISEELLDLFQWLCIVVVGALSYVPLGQVIASATHFPAFYSNLMAYTLVALTIRLIIGTVKRAAGEKLIQSDAFGSFEYYLGMIAGATRLICILLFALSFVHAKYVSDSERLATAQMQADNFGTISFPTFGSLQHSIFYESLSGKFIRKNLRAQLVKPAYAGISLNGDTMGHRRESAVEEVLK